MRPPKRVLYLGTNETTSVMRRMQFRVRTQYRLRTVDRGVDALCVLRELQSTHVGRVDSLDLVVIELPLGESVRELMGCLRVWHPEVPVLLVSEKRSKEPRSLAGANAFWSHALASSVRLFDLVDQLCRHKTGPKPAQRQTLQAVAARRLTLEETMMRRAA